MTISINFINPFLATGHFLYHLKASENQRFSDVLRGYSKGPMAENGSMPEKTCTFKLPKKNFKF